MMASKSTGPDDKYFDPSIVHHSTARHALDQQIISELHDSNSDVKIRRAHSNSLGNYNVESDNVDLITKLRIKVAVTESNLQHAIKERDEAINGSMLITKALSAALSRSDKDSRVRELEEELNKLRLEKAFWHNNEAKKVLSEAREASCLKDNHIHSRTRYAHAEDISRDGPDSFSNLFDPSNSYNPHMLPPPNQTAENTSIPSGAIPVISRALSAEQRASYSDPWEQSFDSNSATIPNTPIVIAKTPLRPPPDLQPQAPTKMSTQVMTATDVGFPSLDAAMGSDLGDASLMIFERKNLGSELTIGIDEQIDRHVTGIKSISELPKPTVLKAGFDPKGSFKGHEYDAEKSRTQYLENQVRAPSSNYLYSHHITRNYNCIPPVSAPTGPRADADQIQWSSLWNSWEEREDAIDTHRRAAYKEKLLPDVFRYGLLYLPAAGAVQTFRTVSIGKIPAKIELRDVLAKVRGGEVVKAILLDTMKLMGSNTVLVEFLNEVAATDYLSYTAVHSISLGDDDEVADISHIRTATYPSFSTYRSMRELGQTRSLAIRRFPKDQSISRLERDIACHNQLRAESLIEIYLDEEDTLHMEFSSVNAAGSAFGILTGWQSYKWLEVVFERDQCAGPLKELELPARPRHPMIPRARYNPAVTPPVEHVLPDQVPGIQRKRLAALTNQAVTIPSFSGRQIKSDTNWADEVNDDVDEIGVKNEVEDSEIIDATHIADAEPRQFVQGFSTLDDVFDAPTLRMNIDEIDIDISVNDTPTPPPASDPPPYHLSLPKFEEHAVLFKHRLSRNTDEELAGGTVCRKGRGKRSVTESATSESVSSETDVE